MKNDFALVDVWRNLHPGSREFTWFNSSFSIGSRLDKFLVSRELLSPGVECNISPCPISDHNFVSLVFDIPAGVKRSPGVWNFNNSLLKDKDFCTTLENLLKKGMRFRSVLFWRGEGTQPKLVKNLSVYFSVNTVVTSQQILEAFDPAGIDIDCITSIRWRASNRSWIVSFNSALAKETALETASVEIGGTAVFLGNCENSLVLIKIYKAPNELPHTALIGRLSHYGRVLSFRRHKIAQFINNGVRTARMTLTLFLLSPDLIGANDVMPVLAVFQLSGLPPLNVNVRIAFSARKAFI